MTSPVDLLLITWNRREYAEKTLDNLLKDPADFRLYCWDNGSSDGTADLVASLDDPRIVERHLDKENVGQRLPSVWFFEKSKRDVIGKVDDDILLPHGWTERIAPMIRRNPRYGVLGCWTFMPEDWNEVLAQRNIVRNGDDQVLRCVNIGGCALLLRKDLVLRYECIPRSHGFPIDQEKMSLDGLVVGYPLPLLFAHHMDDPRSEHCVMTRAGPLGEYSALTARKHGFRSVEDYTKWIVADARERQRLPFSWLLFWRALDRSTSLPVRLGRRLLRPLRPELP